MKQYTMVPVALVMAAVAFGLGLSLRGPAPATSQVQAAMAPAAVVEDQGSDREEPAKKAPAPATKVVSPDEAAKMIGQHVTVRFRVVAVGSTRNKKGAFLNDRPYKRGGQGFTAFIKDVEECGRGSSYIGKVVEVTGDVISYNGKPEIVIEDKAQIKVLKEGGR